MKQKDVFVGDEVWTYVGGERVQVRVCGQTVMHNGRVRFSVQRCDNGKRLPKMRTAASLHRENTAGWPSMTERQD